MTERTITDTPESLRRIGDRPAPRPAAAQPSSASGSPGLRTLTEREPAAAEPTRTELGRSDTDQTDTDQTDTDQTDTDRDQTDTDQTDRDQTDRDQTDRDQTDRDQTDRDQTGRPMIAKRISVKESGDELAGGDGQKGSAVTHRRSSGRRMRLIGALVALLGVVALAAVVVLGIKVHDNATTANRRGSALSAAKTYGAYLASYDYRNLTGKGSDWAKVEANATASFRKNFSSTSGTVGKLLTQYNATSTGKVISAGLASFTSSRAVVLLFIDQDVRNTVQKSASSVQPLRAQLTLLRHGGKWLINDLQVPN